MWTTYLFVRIFLKSVTKIKYCLHSQKPPEDLVTSKQALYGDSSLTQSKNLKMWLWFRNCTKHNTFHSKILIASRSSLWVLSHWMKPESERKFEVTSVHIDSYFSNQKTSSTEDMRPRASHQASKAVRTTPSRLKIVPILPPLTALKLRAGLR